jgi:hypothetical protein
MAVKKEHFLNTLNEESTAMNNERDVPTKSSITDYNCMAARNYVNRKKDLVVKKVCTVCHKTEEDMTVVQYECRCVKLVCAKCSQQLMEPSEDCCTAHPHYPRIDTKELREKLKHVPLEM